MHKIRGFCKTVGVLQLFSEGEKRERPIREIQEKCEFFMVRKSKPKGDGEGGGLSAPRYHLRLITELIGAL